MPTLQQQIADLRKRIESLPADARPAELTPLEAEARALLTNSKNTPFEEEAKALLAELARRAAPPAPDAVRSMLRRARIRMEMAAGDDDFDEAIDILAEALDQASGNADILALLYQAAGRGSQHAMKVRDLLKRYGHTLDLSQATPIPETSPAPSYAETPAYDEEAPDAADYVNAPSGPVPAAGRSSVETLMAEITQAYYAGDYARSIELANRVLAIQPENAAALDYRQKAEDNLIRGIVPDHRIPFDARVAYNRANSLVRAGNYEEARRLYREARDIAERAGIASWKDAEQALLDIEDLALARELLADGDRLMAADDWSEALRKYEGAQRVVPSDPMAQERIELVRQVQQDYDKASVQLNMMSGGLQERVNSLGELMNTLASLRQILPGSARLRNMADEINRRLSTLKTQLVDQGKGALTRAESASALDEKYRLAGDAVKAFETANAIDPGDGSIAQEAAAARQIEASVAEARGMIERASALMAQNFDNELFQARNMLAGLRSFAQDPKYRTVVGDLLMHYVERIESAIDQRDASTAERWLALAKDEPFRVLGRRSELLQLEDEIRGLQRQRTVRTGLMVVAVLIVLGMIAFFSRDAWLPLVTPPTATYTPSATFTPSASPTASDTPTVTNTPTATFTPSLTWTPSATATPTNTPTSTHTATATFTATASFTPSDTPTSTNTPTSTYTPSATFTPSITPTPRIRCVVAVPKGGAVSIRDEPSIARVPVGTAQGGQAMNVLIVRSVDGFAWYFVEYKIGDSTVSGWVQAGRVQEITGPCE